MLHEGANGETASQIEKALGIENEDFRSVSEYYSSLMYQLPQVESKIRIIIGNSFFYKPGFPVRPEYLKTLEKYYEAYTEKTDLSTSGGIKKVNDWCEKKTNGLIPAIFDRPQKDLSAVLMNSLYFNGEWAAPFNKGKTSYERFEKEDGRKTKVKMMKLSEKILNYGSDQMCEWVSLPYGDNNAFAMHVVLPKEGITLKSLMSGFDGARLERVRNGRPCTLELWLPRFEIKNKIDLKEILPSMGMPRLASGGDFSKISEGLSGFDKFFQASAINVDEEGTKAAAITIVGITTGVKPPEWDNIVFHADHPFLFLITENKYGIILFAGCFTGK